MAIPKHIVGLMQTWNELERQRKLYRCPKHPEGNVSLEYHAPSRSWLFRCMEKNKVDDKYVCGYHEHFDPTDWEDDTTT